MSWLTCIALLALSCLAASVVAAPVSILDAKKLADNSAVELSGKVLTAIFPGYFYVSESDNSAGLRVVSSETPVLGGTVDITGTMATNASHERQVAASSAVIHGYVPPLIPNNQVGGDNFFYNPATGAGQQGVPVATSLPNNIGDLVRTTGTVTMGATGDAADFPIDDGTHVGLLVVIAPGITNPGFSAQVTVTGISSIRYVAGVTRRAILLRGPQDVVVNQPAPECKYTAEMVYIPRGESYMGLDYNSSDVVTYPASPKIKIYLDGYWIGKYEVTRAEYRKFIDAGGYINQEYWTDEGWWWRLQYRNNHPWCWDDAYWYQGDNYPVIGVSPYEMDAYCKWAGVRRTTESEWEKAACWDPVTGFDRRYPWGDVWDAQKCNNANDTIWPFASKAGPVGMYSDGVSYYGCHDMAGNVFEWCKGFYASDWYSHPPAIGWIDSQGPDRPEYDYYNTQVYRGGSWYPGELEQRCAHRFGQIACLYNADIGFRVTR
jgi:formylglycine-generating enzyme required for sulfatase activity